MSDAQEKATAAKGPLTWEGRSFGAELDVLLNDAGADIEALQQCDEVILSVTGISGNVVHHYGMQLAYDDGIVVGNALGSTVTEENAGSAKKLFDQLKGGLWDWPVEESADA